MRRQRGEGSDGYVVTVVSDLGSTLVLRGGHDLGSGLAILVRDQTLRVAVVCLVLGTLSVLDVVTIMLFMLHDAMDSTWVAVLAIVVQATSKLPLFVLAMALVDVAASIAAVPVLKQVGARSAPCVVFAQGWLTSSWMVGSLLFAGRLDRLHECRLNVDAADLDAVLLSSTRAVATRRYAMAASASGEALARWRRAIATHKLACGLLNVGSPASSISRRRSWAHGCTAWHCSTNRL
jgi:hypothetical protein